MRPTKYSRTVESRLEPNWDALIEDCLNHPGDESKLVLFLEVIGPYLRAALLSTYSHDVSLVEDALQSAFLKFIKILRTPQNAQLRVHYFLIIAKNCLIDELRRRKPLLPIDQVAESELPFLPATDENEQELRMLLLQHGMMQLDARCQFILESYYINEIEAKMIASWLEIAPDSVHMAIKRCRDRLRGILVSFESVFSIESAGSKKKTSMG